MLERIIVAPSANEAELLRTLAAYGVNTLGVRIMNGVKFAEYAVVIGWIGEEFQENFGTDYTYDDLTDELRRRGYEEYWYFPTENKES